MRISKDDIKRIRKGVEIEKYIDQVQKILNKVLQEKDDAIVKMTREIDKVDIDDVEIDREEIEKLSIKVDPEIRKIIDVTIRRISEFNSKLIPRNEIVVQSGEIATIRYVSIERIGIYVPRGYISTLMMLATIAKIAGCRDIVIFTPPVNSEHKITPEMAYVLKSLKIYKIYVGNGVAGIGALAYGTDKIPKTYKIFGPGNIYIQTAKYLVSRTVDIDGIEGPTELVLYIDSTVSERDIKCAIMDVLAEIEHGRHSIGVVLSDSEDILNMFEKEYENNKHENMGILYTVKIENMEDAVKIINEIAPEHVEIISRKYREIVNKLVNAGIISINTPCTYLDYVAGPCHVLPTSGFARSRGTITPLDFMKKIIIYEGYSRDMLGIGKVLAELENLKYHYKSLECRLL